MGETNDATEGRPAATEQPEDKDLQDHTFGQAMQERAERAERGEPDPGEEREHHAAGKA